MKQATKKTAAAKRYAGARPKTANMASKKPLRNDDEKSVTLSGINNYFMKYPTSKALQLQSTKTPMSGIKIDHIIKSPNMIFNSTRGQSKTPLRLPPKKMSVSGSSVYSSQRAPMSRVKSACKVGQSARTSKYSSKIAMMARDTAVEAKSNKTSLHKIQTDMYSLKQQLKSQAESL